MVSCSTSRGDLYPVTLANKSWSRYWPCQNKINHQSEKMKK